MKLTKYLGMVLLAGTLTACGDDFLDPKYSGYATSEEIAGAAQDDPQGVLGSQLDGVYATLSFKSATGADGINGHMDRGLCGVMMLSNNTSNDVSLSMGNGDPWHFDKQLDYYAQEYIRAGWGWNLFYTIIKGANDVIPMIDPETATADGKAMLGQALALRGLSYFYLAQLYQDTYATSQDKLCVPILLTEKDENPSIEGRATVKQVYAQIESDLTRAIALLDGWKRATKTQIDKQVAQGILSRVYLVMHKWSKVIELAQAARAGYPLMDATTAYDYNYQDVTNSEVMWGVDITTSTSMIYASFQSWMCAQYYGYGGQVGAFQLIDANIYNSIADNDVRKYLYVAPGDTYPCEDWTIPAYGNLKFKAAGAEDFLGDYIYMRSSEMVLAEAEALSRLGRAQDAYTVISELVNNRLLEGEWEYKKAPIEVIQMQRRIELWGEGFSYFDHRRWQMDMDRGYEGTNEPESTWPAHVGKGFVPWYHYAWRYQLPLREIQENEAITEDDQNVIGEEGNQDPVADKITDWSEK